MNDKALKTLEYDKIIARLETYASSSMGKKQCAALLPLPLHHILLLAL